MRKDKDHLLVTEKGPPQGSGPPPDFSASCPTCCVCVCVTLLNQRKEQRQLRQLLVLNLIFNKNDINYKDGEFKKKKL